MTLCEWHQEKADRDGCWFCEHDKISAEKWAGITERLRDQIMVDQEKNSNLANELTCLRAEVERLKAELDTLTNWHNALLAACYEDGIDVEAIKRLLSTEGEEE